MKTLHLALAIMALVLVPSNARKFRGYFFVLVCHKIKFVLCNNQLTSKFTTGPYSLQKRDQPSLSPHCLYEKCAFPLCFNGELFTPEGECCPVCRPFPPLDCSLVRCAIPFCINSELVTPRGECCPICQPVPPPDCFTKNCDIPQWLWWQKTPNFT